MKKLLLLLFLFFATFSSAFAYTAKYKISCNNEDCFRFGWKMVSILPGYKLEATCKKNDCTKFGWRSLDSAGSRFNVSCKEYGCFDDGWFSVEKIKNKTKYDLAVCKGNGCLVDGWNVTTSYGESGTVTCKNHDCATFGGLADWRKKSSKTTCIKNDCYRYGWFLDILR